MELNLDLRNGQMDLAGTLRTLGCEIIGLKDKEPLQLVRFSEGWSLVKTNHDSIFVLMDPNRNMCAYVIKEGPAYYGISSWF